MLTSEQMLFTVALFGHVLIAGIMLLIAVTLDDSTWARPPTTTMMRAETKRTKTSPTKPAVVRELDEVARAAYLVFSSILPALSLLRATLR